MPCARFACHDTDQVERRSASYAFYRNSCACRPSHPMTAVEKTRIRIHPLAVQLAWKMHSAKFAINARHDRVSQRLHALARTQTQTAAAAHLGDLLSMRGPSQQVMRDAVFGSLSEDGHWPRSVSGGGFAKARDRLAWSASTPLSCSAYPCAGLDSSAGMVGARWRPVRKLDYPWVSAPENQIYAAP